MSMFQAGARALALSIFVAGCAHVETRRVVLAITGADCVECARVDLQALDRAIAEAAR